MGIDAGATVHKATPREGVDDESRVGIITIWEHTDISAEPSKLLFRFSVHGIVKSCVQVSLFCVRMERSVVVFLSSHPTFLGCCGVLFFCCIVPCSGGENWAPERALQDVRVQWPSFCPQHSAWSSTGYCGGSARYFWSLFEA